MQAITSLSEAGGVGGKGYVAMCVVYITAECICRAAARPAAHISAICLQNNLIDIQAALRGLSAACVGAGGHLCGGSTPDNARACRANTMTIAGSMI